MKPHYLLIISLFTSISSLFAQLTPTTVNIPMRDAKTLAADVYLPNNTDTFPVIFVQTPYNKNTFRQTGLPLGVRQNLSSSNYAFVIMDWRGFYGSAAAFSLTGDKGKDGYDAIEWISNQTWCNGKIGTWGPSALSNVQFETAYEQHPNHLCAVPEVTMPQTRYDKYYPGGVLEVASLQTLSVLFGSSGFKTVVENPHYNNVWSFVENSTLDLPNVAIPMLIVGGWYDHNIQFDIRLLQMMQTQTDVAVRNKHKMLIGPWVHGGVGLAYVGSDIQGELNYPLAAGENNSYENQFFDYYLRDIQNNWEVNTVFKYYQMGEDVWKTTATFENELDTLVFSTDENFKLVMTEVTGGSSTKSFAYDPEDPSPTIGGKTLHPDLDQGPYNQQAVIDRSDALYFETDIFLSMLHVTGAIKAKIIMQPGAVDTDIALRLVDVYPDGRKILIDDDIQRLRFRNGYTINDTSFMDVNNTYQFDITFDPIALSFPAGHKLGLIVTGSNYPRYNRNMNTGEKMYPNNSIDTLVNPQTITNQLVVGGGSIGTRLIVPGKFDGSNSVVTKNSIAINVFPNPVMDELHVLGLMKDSEIAILDVTGKKQACKQTKKGSEVLVDVTELASGVYFLHVGTSLQRFIKK
jgi:predicted acyl esterase